jgi:hypothetical protein
MPLNNMTGRHDSLLYYTVASFFKNREYLREFEVKFENILDGLSGPQAKLFHREKQKQKIP